MTLGDVLNHYPSSIVIATMAFAFLWLALYIYRVNPEDSASKLASGSMISIFVYLFGSFMVITATKKPEVILYQRILWWLPFAPVLWLHLSQKATPPLEFKHPLGSQISAIVNAMRTSAAMGAFYGIAALFFLSGIFTDSLFKFSGLHKAKLPLGNHGLPTGPAYKLFAVFMFVVVSVACINFLAAWWKDVKKGSKSALDSQFLWLTLGTILLWAASIGLLVKIVTDIHVRHSPGNIVLGVGMVIVAFAILKRNALHKKEALQRDAIYASIGALGVSAIYATALFIGQGGIMGVPVISLVLVTTLALTTHMLADELKIRFSQLIGTRLGLFSTRDVDKMRQLYHEASRIKRRQEPAVELFNDGNKTVEQLLDLLTPRQREIITLRAKGLSDKQIADVLNIKLPTVRKHTEDIKDRIGSRDKADCAIYCVVTGLLSKEDLMDWFDSLDFANQNKTENR